MTFSAEDFVDEKTGATPHEPKVSRPVTRDTVHIS
jgi:hypothetical protein